MNSDQLLNRLVVAAITIFATVSLLMAAFIVREIWLQQRAAELSATLQVNIEELEQTTEELQTTVSEIQSTTDAPQEAEELAELLELVDEQLTSIGETISAEDEDAALSARQTQTETLPILGETVPLAEEGSVEVTGAVRLIADQVFTIFAVLTGIAAVAIAVLLGVALRVQDSRPAVPKENGS